MPYLIDALPPSRRFHALSQSLPSSEHRLFILFYTELWFSEKELQRLNLLVSQFLDFAEFQALEERPMRMADWIAALDNQTLALQRKLLEGKGSVSHKAAIEKAEREFLIYRRREMERLESDFDKMVKQLPKRGKNPQ